MTLAPRASVSNLTDVPRQLEVTFHAPPRTTLPASSPGGVLTDDPLGSPPSPGGNGHNDPNPFSPFICVAASTSYLACGTDDGRIVLFSVEERHVCQTVDCADLDGGRLPEPSVVRLTDVAFSADGSWLMGVVAREPRAATSTTSSSSSSSSVEVWVWQVRAGVAPPVPPLALVGRAVVPECERNSVEFTVEVCGAGVDAVWGGAGTEDVLTTPVKPRRRVEGDGGSIRKGKRGKAADGILVDMNDANDTKDTKDTKDTNDWNDWNDNGGRVLGDGDCLVRGLVTDVRGGRVYWLTVGGNQDAVSRAKKVKCDVAKNGQDEVEGAPLFSVEFVEVPFPPGRSSGPEDVGIDDRVELYWADNEDEKGKLKPEWFKGTVAQVRHVIVVSAVA